MSNRNTVHFTTRSSELPAYASVALMFSSVCRVWPVIPVSASWRVPGTTPIWPERYSMRSEEHTSELQSRLHLVCRLLLEKKKKKVKQDYNKHIYHNSHINT